MKAVAIGAHLRAEDVTGEARAFAIDEGLVVSAVAIADDQPLGDRELLLRVARVRAQLLEAATFVAIRYGFAIASETDARAKCAPFAARWRALLERHREHVEMTLKLAASAPQPRPDRRDFANGAEYLRALHRATNAAAVDESFRAAVESQLVPLAVAHRWRHRDNASLELALLVERSRVAEVNAAGAALKESAVPFLLSGPWPLEVFADDHE